MPSTARWPGHRFSADSQRAPGHDGRMSSASPTTRRARWAVPAAAARPGRRRPRSSRASTADARDSPAAAHRGRSCSSTCSSAQLHGLSGTVVADRRPRPPGSCPGDRPGVERRQHVALVAGLGLAHLRVWYAGPTAEPARAARPASGESDLVRNGTDLWLWSSTRQHRHPLHAAGRRAARPTPAGDARPTCRARPQQAAEAALAAIDPTTEVTHGPARPRWPAARRTSSSSSRGTPASLVGPVRIAIDGEQHVPLRVQVFAKVVDARRSRSASRRSTSARPTRVSSGSPRRRARRSPTRAPCRPHKPPSAANPSARRPAPSRRSSARAGPPSSVATLARRRQGVR